MSKITIHAAGDYDTINLSYMGWGANENGLHIHLHTPEAARSLLAALTIAVARMDERHPDAKVYADGTEAVR